MMAKIDITSDKSQGTMVKSIKRLQCGKRSMHIYYITVINYRLHNGLSTGERKQDLFRKPICPLNFLVRSEPKIELVVEPKAKIFVRCDQFNLFHLS